MKVSEIRSGHVEITATITHLSSHRIRNGNLMIEATVADTTGTTKCVWFKKNLPADLEKGAEYTFSGSYELKYGRLALQMPKYTATGEHPSTEYLASSPYVLPPHQAPTKQTLWSRYGDNVSTALGVLFWVAVIGGFIWYSNASSTKNASSTSSTHTSYAPVASRASSDNQGNQVTQYYWYCWDSGSPNPHHLGHPVSGDHLCTNSELAATGTPSSASSSASSSGAQVTQYYWYCWDTGSTSPHHLGHPVAGDHLCTNAELHSAGWSGY